MDFQDEVRIHRLQAMADANGEWGFSQKDSDAIRWLLEQSRRYVPIFVNRGRCAQGGRLNRSGAGYESRKIEV